MRVIFCFCLFFSVTVNFTSEEASKKLGILIIYINYVSPVCASGFHHDIGLTGEKRRKTQRRAGRLNQKNVAKFIPLSVLTNSIFFSICIFSTFSAFFHHLNTMLRNIVIFRKRPQEIFGAFYFLLPHPSRRCFLKLTQIRNLFSRRAQRKKKKGNLFIKKSFLL